MYMNEMIDTHLAWVG